MLTVIGAAIKGRVPDVTTPKAYPNLSARRVLTMSFVEGEPLGDIIQRALRATAGGPPGSPISSSPGFHERAAAGMQTKGGVSVDGNALVARLCESYGTQIFGIGKFHSDPHPGNVLVGPDGKTLSIIDFGQTKVLDDKTRLGICRLMLALAADRAEETLAYAKALGLEISGASEQFAMTVCYILFDTRMDLIEAHLSPLDAHVPPEMRAVKLETIPEEIFMLIRVVALMRGHAHLAQRPGRPRADDLAPVRHGGAQSRRRAHPGLGAGPRGDRGRSRGEGDAILGLAEDTERWGLRHKKLESKLGRRLRRGEEPDILADEDSVRLDAR
jgi:aarF domain-containing kinase